MLIMWGPHFESLCCTEDGALVSGMLIPQPYRPEKRQDSHRPCVRLVTTLAMSYCNSQHRPLARRPMRSWRGIEPENILEGLYHSCFDG